MPTYIKTSHCSTQTPDWMRDEEQLPQEEFLRLSHGLHHYITTIQPSFHKSLMLPSELRDQIILHLLAHEMQRGPYLRYPLPKLSRRTYWGRFWNHTSKSLCIKYEPTKDSADPPCPKFISNIGLTCHQVRVEVTRVILRNMRELATDLYRPSNAG
jgi:hypothetical protein